MQADDATYLHHKLAKVSADLAKTEQALAAYKKALSQPLSVITDTAKTGDFLLATQDLNVFEDFVEFCETNSFPEEARKIRLVLESVKHDKKTKPDAILKVDLLILKFLTISSDKAGIIQGYTEVLEKATANFGDSSQQVQDIHVEYAKTLHKLGTKEELLDTIYERLHVLTPGYLHPINMDTNNSGEKTLISRIVNRLQRPKSKQQESQALFQSATEAYNQADFEIAFQTHCQAANLFNVESIFALGTYYQLGIGCEINMVDARKYYLRASKMGHANAQHHYAVLLQTGLGGETDLDSAVKWYKNASLIGNSSATMNLAYLYVSTLTGGPFYATGIACFLRAYEQGNENGFNVAMQYMATPVDLFNQ